MSDFTRFLPGFYKLQKKNRRNLLCYSGLGGMWGSRSSSACYDLRYNVAYR